MSLRVIATDADLAEGAAYLASVCPVWAQVLPQLKAIGNYTRLDETPAYESDGDMIATGREDNYAAGAEVSQLLFSGFAPAQKLGHLPAWPGPVWKRAGHGQSGAPATG